MRYLRIADECAAGTENRIEENNAFENRSASVLSRRGRKETPPTVATTQVEKILQNGDLFHGEFAGNAPHGRGKYLWADGCMYEGEWSKGKAFGKGKFSWPSGATYEGEFKSGRMEGFGTFIGADGDTYRGSWIADRKHGSGKKFYANGDFYDGQWRRNVQDGDGVYVWRNGNQFIGEWRGGVISGRGIFISANGNRYEGGGIFTCKQQQQQQLNVKFNSAAVLASRKRSLIDGVLTRDSVGEKNFPRICIWEADNEAGDITCEIVDKVDASVVYKDGSEFVHGEDLRQMRLRKPCCFESGYVKKPGQIICKGHKNYDLMLKVQFGIRYSVGKSSSAEIGELKATDFDPKEKFWTRFPPEGSKITPPHQSVDFKWKDYCPQVFRHLRKLFSVHPADYMMALCGNEALRELSSPGKSGSLFYLTQDDRFIIKTVKKNEVKVLIKMLSSYYQHVCKHGNSLLTKFYGVHCVKPIGCQKVRFIVMGNLLCSEYRIHRRFDLKGSSHGRTIHKAEEEIDETTTLKDLDLNFIFHIKRPWLKKLIWQIEQDCEFLVAEGIMDYSLLVGVHFRDDGYNSDMGISVPSQKSQWRDASRVDGPESGWRDTARVHGRKPPIQLGANLPARAEHVDHENDLRSGKIYEVVLYLGTIDILQDYDISKKIEHAYKSFHVDSTSISAVDPKLYSKRFRDFISRVFVEDDD